MAYGKWATHMERMDKDSKLAKLTKRVAELEKRLEISTAHRGDGVSMIVPEDMRDAIPDGIECRDETIRLLEQKVSRLQEENAQLKTENVQLKVQIRGTVKSLMALF